MKLLQLTSIAYNSLHTQTQYVVVVTLHCSLIKKYMGVKVESSLHVDQPTQAKTTNSKCCSFLLWIFRHIYTDDREEEIPSCFLSSRSGQNIPGST